MSVNDYAGNGRGYLTCAIPACLEAHYSKRLCENHYQAWYRERKRNGYVHPRVTLEELKAAVSDKTPECNLAVCEKPTHAKGLCQTHYVQYTRLNKQERTK
jgi:hypothetical protein